MSARPALAASILVSTVAWGLVAGLPKIRDNIWNAPVESLWLSTKQGWLNILIVWFFAYTLTGTCATTITFATHLHKVSRALRRLSIRVATKAPSVQDWYDALRFTELEPLSDRLLAFAFPLGTSPAQSSFAIMAPFNAGTARNEIFRRYMLRLSLLQIWSVMVLLFVGSILFLTTLPASLESAAPLFPVWLPLCVTLLLGLGLIVAVSLIANQCDSLATVISRLPFDRRGSEDASASLVWRLPLHRAQDPSRETAAAELRNEIVDLRVKLLELLERQHRDMAVAVREGLRNGLYPLSQELTQLAGDAAKSDLDRVGGTIKTAFNSLMDDIEQRTSAPLVEAKRLLVATTRAVATLSQTVAQLRQDGAEQGHVQSERPASLAGELIAQKPQPAMRILEQYESSCRAMAEAHRDAIVELGSTTKALIDQLSEVNAEAQRQAAIDREGLRQEVEKLSGTVEALSVRLVPSLRRLSAVDQRLGAAFDRHESTSLRNQALMEEIAGLLEGTRSVLERVVDAVVRPGQAAAVPAQTSSSKQTDVKPGAPSLRDELEALRSEMAADEPKPLGDPGGAAG